ncbi:helix-turn-helix domain-containing protein [Bacteroides sedimenti]|uniref:AraC family transcriptional regulator n=1 Tax=Bacteroides sedimenti TaxID=2136147 RepID=A0ABM8IF65_9BACE
MEKNKLQNLNLSDIEKDSDIDFIDNDFAIFSDIKDVPLFEYPSRIDLCVFCIPLTGYARVGINLKDYYFKKNDLALIMPRQIIQLYEKSDDFAGIFFALSNDFMNEIAVNLEKKLSIFLYIKDNPHTTLSDQEVLSIMEYHSFLWEKVKDKENDYRKEIAKNLLRALVFEVYSIFDSHLPVKRFQSRREELFESFLILVSENFQKERSVSFYAERLFLTPKHLSRVVREASGRSASEWIDEQVILEAKVRLKSSLFTVQEIADKLRFPNQSFFGKYFKQHTGMSPSEYRKK